MRNRTARHRTSQSVTTSSGLKYKRPIFHALVATSALLTGATVEATAASSDGAAEAPAVQNNVSSSAPSSPQAPDDRLEEVVVEARRYRPTDQTTATGLDLPLIDTPQAITVLTPEMLNVAGATSVYEAADLVPGLRRGGESFGVDTLVLRGNVVSTARINGTVFTAGESLESYAMSREEIVRGPATVLYGVTGSFGGEINQVLKNPLQQPRAEFGVVDGNLGLRELQMDVTGPIPGTDDVVSGRLVAIRREFSAPVSVVGISNNKSVVSGALQFQLSDATVSHLWFYTSSLNQDPQQGGSLQELPNHTLTLPNVPPGNWYYGDPRYDHSIQGQTFVIGDLEHTFANDWKAKTQVTVDNSHQYADEYYSYGPAGAYALKENQVYQYSYDRFQKSEEATFDASLGGKFKLLGREHDFFAAFESQGSIGPHDNLLLTSVPVGIVNIYQGGQGVLANGSPTPLVDRATLPVNLFTQTRFVDERGSVQVLFHPTDKFDVLAGGLVQHTREESVTLVSGAKPVIDPQRVPTVYTQFLKRFGLTYSLLENWGPVDESKVYASYSEGFNPNLNLFTPSGSPITTPELMNSYEIGLKTDFLNRAIGSSISLYDSRLKNIPFGLDALGLVDVSGTVISSTERVTGVEMEVVGQIVKGWNIAANYAYTDSVQSDPHYDFTAPVQSVPRNAGAVFSSYEFTSGVLQGLRMGGAVVASSNYSFVNSLQNVQKFGTFSGDANTRVNLNASYKPATGSLAGFELYANANNIFNKILYNSQFTSPAFSIVRDNPRTFKVGLRYTFK